MTSLSSNNSPDNFRATHAALTPLYGLAALYCAFMLAILLILAVMWPLLLPNLRLRRSIVRRWLRISFFIAGAPISTTGKALTEQPCLLVANHASYLDGLLLQAVLPSNFSVLVKGEAESWPIIGSALRRLGLLFVARGDAQRSSAVLRQLIRGLNNGESFALFPEGTFQREPGLIPFQPGAFHVASRTKSAVQPVVLLGSRRALPDGSWLPRPGRLQVHFLPPQHADAKHQEDASNQLLHSVRQAMLAVLDEPDCAHSTTNQPI